jgi:hypothetical protein
MPIRMTANSLLGPEIKRRRDAGAGLRSVPRARVLNELISAAAATRPACHVFLFAFFIPILPWRQSLQDCRPGQTVSVPPFGAKDLDID